MKKQAIANFGFMALNTSDLVTKSAEPDRSADRVARLRPVDLDKADEYAVKLIEIVEHNHAWRRMDAMGQAAEFLLSLPVAPEYQLAGSYYKALHLKSSGASLDTVRQTLETVACSPGFRVPGRALLSLGAVAFRAGHHREELAHYRSGAEIAQTCEDWQTLIQCRKMAAVWKARAGDHRQALAELEAIRPDAERLSPGHIYLDYINSLAVELVYCGQLSEALVASEMAANSAYSRAYPEWQETHEAARKLIPRRSFISLLLPGAEAHSPHRSRSLRDPRAVDVARNVARLDFQSTAVCALTPDAASAPSDHKPAGPLSGAAKLVAAASTLDSQPNSVVRTDSQPLKGSSPVVVPARMLHFPPRGKALYRPRMRWSTPARKTRLAQQARLIELLATKPGAAHLLDTMLQMVDPIDKLRGLAEMVANGDLSGIAMDRMIDLLESSWP